MKFTYIALALCYVLIPSLLQAIECPGYIYGSEINKKFVGQPRQNIRLFINSSDQTLTERPMHIVPLDQYQVLTNSPESQSRNRGGSATLSVHDRLIINPRLFGPKLSSRASKTPNLLPCNATWVQEISSPSGQEFAYLAYCRGSRKVRGKQPVVSSPKLSTINSSFFKFKHAPDNILLFEDISLNGPKGWQTVGKSADLWLHLDVRKFFSLDLDKSDLSAQLMDVVPGPYGLIHRLNFYIHILFFKIDLEMSTLFSFYEKSGHSPIVMNVPVNAWEHLHPGSGIFLNWDPANTKFVTQETRFSTPKASPSHIHKGFLESAKLIKNQCQAGQCRFDLNTKAGDLYFRVQVNIPEKHARRGLVPQRVDDGASFVKTMDWDEDPDFPHKRVGIFFDNTGLPTGTHPIDYWFYPISNPTDPRGCPVRFSIGSIIGDKGARDTPTIAPSPIKK